MVSNTPLVITPVLDTFLVTDTKASLDHILASAWANHPSHFQSNEFTVHATITEYHTDIPGMCEALTSGLTALLYKTFQTVDVQIQESVTTLASNAKTLTVYISVTGQDNLTVVASQLLKISGGKLAGVADAINNAQ